MATGTLTGQTIANTYKALLKITGTTTGGETLHATTQNVIEDGDGNPFPLSAAQDALMITSTNRLEFGTNANYVYQVGSNVLGLVAGSEIDLTATAIDINGTVDMSSTLTVNSNTTITTADNTDTLSLISTDADANSGSNLRLYRNSSSPANDDAIGWIDFEGRNNNSQDVIYSSIYNYASDVSDGSEDGSMYIKTMLAGTLRNTVSLLPTEVVFNDEGQDVDFRVESDNNSEMFKVDAGANKIFINQDQDAIGIDIDTESTTKQAIRVLDAKTTTGKVIEIGECDALTTGNIAKFYSNSVSDGSRDLVTITNNSTSATGAKALKIIQNAAVAAMIIDQNANGIGLKIESASTSSECIKIIDAACQTNGVINVSDANDLTTGFVAAFRSNSDSTGARNIVDIRNDHVAADNAVPLYLKQDGNNKVMQVEAGDGSFTGDMILLNAVGRSSSDAFSFIKTFTDGDNDVQHYMRGDGAFLADGAYSDGGADYAEYFESKDGKAIAVGKTVKLDGDKVVACEDGDNPMGVVRPYGNSVVIGNAAPLKWTGKYLKDDYGAYIREEYSITVWIEDSDKVKHEAVEAKDAVLYKESDEIPKGKKVGDVKEAAIEAKDTVYEHKDVQYNTDKIPSDVTVPSDATVTSTEKDGTKLTRKKKNPDYDESETYAPREEREEWCLIGLLGQIPITKGQPMADNWVKMKDVSDTVEMYFVK